MNLYFIIDASTAQEWNGRKSKYAPDTFAAEKLKDGSWACGFNTISSFPEAFVNTSFVVREVMQGELWEKTEDGAYVEMSAPEVLLNKAKTIIGLPLVSTNSPDEFEKKDAVLESSSDVKESINSEIEKTDFYYSEEKINNLWAYVVIATMTVYFVAVGLKSCN